MCCHGDAWHNGPQWQLEYSCSLFRVKEAQQYDGGGDILFKMLIK